VTVNNKIITDPAYQVNSENDDVRLEGRQLKQAEFIYIILNKPPKFVTTVNDEKGRQTVLDLISIKKRIFPVGRLDYDTRGLLLLTNDGELANKLIHPRYKIKKTYRATLERAIDNEDIKKLQSGVKIGSNEIVVPDSIEVINNRNKNLVLITVHEGKKHEVKRIFQAIGYQIKKLERISFAGITLRKLPPGGWRHLTSVEVKRLKGLIPDKP